MCKCNANKEKLLFSTSFLASFPRPLQTLAYDCNIPKASTGFRRALNVLLGSIREDNGSNYSQLLIPEKLRRGKTLNNADSN